MLKTQGRLARRGSRMNGLVQAREPDGSGEERLDRAGVPVERFGDSSAEVTELT